MSAQIDTPIGQKLASQSVAVVPASDYIPPLPQDTPIDIFGTLITSQRENQIEVHFDDANWATYVTTTQTGGGGATQHEGHVHFTTGVGANGRSKAVTLDSVKYRPAHEVYGAWTATFITAGVASSYMRIGLYGDTDGFFIGYEGTAFGITHRRNSIDTQILRAAWEDPLTGGADSRFTRNGTPEALNVALSNVYRVRFGWLGSASIVFEVLSPDGKWVMFHTIRYPNLQTEPSLTNPDLTMTAEVRKTAADATDLELRTGCWAGGASSSRSRLSDVITDRSLAETVRAVIEGKNPSGTYTKITVNAQGRMLVSNDSVGTDGAAAPSGTTLVGGTDGTNLQSLRTTADGTLRIDPTGSTAQPVTLPSGAHTLTSANVVAGGTVTAGAYSVNFMPSSLYTGTIDGVTYAGADWSVIPFQAQTGKTLPDITYTVTAGSLNIVKLV